MAARSISLRKAAREDLRTAVRYYASEAGEQVALGFTEAFDAAYRLIVENPAAGSPRHAAEVGLPDLRCRMMGRFPCLIFYAETFGHIDIWRVLHASRDIPATLRGDA